MTDANYEAKIDAMAAQIAAQIEELRNPASPPTPRPARPKEEPGFDIDRIKVGMNAEDEARGWNEVRKMLTPAQGVAPEPFELEAIRPGMKTENIRKAELAILQVLKDMRR